MDTFELLRALDILLALNITVSILSKTKKRMLKPSQSGMTHGDKNT